MRVKVILGQHAGKVGRVECRSGLGQVQVRFDDGTWAHLKITEYVPA